MDEDDAKYESLVRWMEENVDPVPTWTPTALTFLWRTQAGEYLHISEIRDGHLLNLERYIQNKGHQPFNIPNRSDAKNAQHTVWIWICDELDGRGLVTVLPVHPGAIERKQGIQRPVAAPSFDPYPNYTKSRSRIRRWSRMGLPV